MKTLILFITLIVYAAVAHSQAVKSGKSKTTASHKTQKSVARQTQSLGIPEDAYVISYSDKQDTAISTTSKAVVITGDNNKLTFNDSNTQLFIKGKNNDVNMRCADYIEITGDGNFVSWETSKSPTGKPQIVDKGGYNNVGKRSSGALNKSDN
jgi:hypothetical protein